jgi:hypothetical protein
MRKSICNALIMGVVLSTGIGSAKAADKTHEHDRDSKAYSQGSKQELDERVKTVNKLTDRKDAMQPALRDISVETGVPMDRVENMHKHHPDAGPAGIMIACVMADETKKDPEEFLKHHVEGSKGWAAMARDNNVSLDKLSLRLDRLETALTTGSTGATPGSMEKNRHHDK